MNFLAGEKHKAPIHREAPTFVEQSTSQEILATGIKVFPVPHQLISLCPPPPLFCLGAADYKRVVQFTEGSDCPWQIQP